MLPHLASIELWGRAERGTINVSHPVINHHCCQHHHRQTCIVYRHADIRHTDSTHWRTMCCKKSLLLSTLLSSWLSIFSLLQILSTGKYVQPKYYNIFTIYYHLQYLPYIINLQYIYHYRYRPLDSLSDPINTIYLKYNVIHNISKIQVLEYF